MSTNIQMEDIIEQEDVSTSEAVEQPDTLKEELEKVRGGRTEEEKATFTFQKQAERLTALGIDPANILGIKKEAPIEQSEDDAPVTLGMLKKMQAEEAKEASSRSALQLAEGIANETERELTKWHLQNTLRSTGNPSQDLELASSIVNAAKNKQIIEEVNRKTPTKQATSSGGAAPQIEQEIELTPDELSFMKAPFHLSKQQIIAARKG